MQSKITSKSQTTVPKEIRRRLGVGPGDVLDWVWMEDGVRVQASSRAFLSLRGAIEIGAGSTVEDVRRARRERGGA